MDIIKTALAMTALTMVGTSAFAADNSKPVVTKDQNSAVHVMEAPVLLDANPYGKTRRIVRVVKTTTDAPIARDASTAADGKFVYKFGKNVKTKTYRPSVSTSDAMPNLFKG